MAVASFSPLCFCSSLVSVSVEVEGRGNALANVDSRLCIVESMCTFSGTTRTRQEKEDEDEERQQKMIEEKLTCGGHGLDICMRRPEYLLRNVLGMDFLNFAVCLSLHYSGV